MYCHWTLTLWIVPFYGISELSTFTGEEVTCPGLHCSLFISSFMSFLLSPHDPLMSVKINSGSKKKKKERERERKKTENKVTIFYPEMGLPGGSDGKESTCSAGGLGLIPVLGRSPGGGHGNPLQDSCLENSHGQGSLVGYSPWGCKE